MGPGEVGQRGWVDAVLAARWHPGGRAGVHGGPGPSHDITDGGPSHLNPVGVGVEVLERVELAPKKDACLVDVGVEEIGLESVLYHLDHLAAQHHQVILALLKVLVVEVGWAVVFLSKAMFVAVDSLIGIHDQVASHLDASRQLVTEEARLEAILRVVGAVVLFEKAENASLRLVGVGDSSGSHNVQKKVGEKTVRPNPWEETGCWAGQHRQADDDGGQSGLHGDKVDQERRRLDGPESVSSTLLPSHFNLHPEPSPTMRLKNTGQPGRAGWTIDAKRKPPNRR